MGFALARARIAIAAGVAALAISLAANGATAPGNLEYQVKAAFLYKFGEFVAWPDSAFASATSPATVCIVGEDPFGAVLDKAVAGQAIGGRPIVVRRLQAAAKDSGCQIMFVGAHPAGPVLAAVKGANVLTVTDAAAGAANAGVINFVIADNKVRFEIDDQAAVANGLSISSKLLSLAVPPRPKG